MASILGSGGLGALSGTASAAAPMVIADFRVSLGGNITVGADGRPCNILTVHNGDATGLYLVRGLASGLQDNGTVSAFTVWPGQTEPLQLSEHVNDLNYVTAWATDMSGNTFSGSITISAHVTSRRG